MQQYTPVPDLWYIRTCLLHVLSALKDHRSKSGGTGSSYPVALPDQPTGLTSLVTIHVLSRISASCLEFPDNSLFLSGVPANSHSWQEF